MREVTNLPISVLMSTPEAIPTTLYRFYDAAGVLLYVGISSIGPVRWLGHQFRDWWTLVATVTTEHFPDRAPALAAEVLAIKTEEPKYNIVHAGIRPDRNPPVHRAHGTGSAQVRMDGRWQVSFTFPDGKRRYWYTRTQPDAELILAALNGHRASPTMVRKAIAILEEILGRKVDAA